MGCTTSAEAVANAPPLTPIASSTAASRGGQVPNPLTSPLPEAACPAAACGLHPDPSLEGVVVDPAAMPESPAAGSLVRKHRSVSPKNFGRVVEEPTPEQQAARAAALAKLAAAHGITPDPGQFTAAGPDPAAARRSSVKCAQWIVAHLRHQARPYDPAQDEAELGAAAASSAPAP
jgi:hypothetical protein